jgi:hypothetical protein
VAPCSADPFEPNDALDDAAELFEGRWFGPSVCADDDDWYRLTVVPGGITTVGIRFDNERGDLDLLAYDAAGRFFASRVGLETYSGPYRYYETDEEYLSGLSMVSAYTFFLRARGATSEASNPYLLELEWTDWQDGPSCTDIYDLAECEGRPGGELKLIQLPFPDPAGAYIGAGYLIDTVPNYLWARREVIMAIRHAIHQVQLRFPGSNPLGIIDICQRDGITPGYDIGHPRHPPQTHDQGGNIDVAYYQTASDNHARIVCDGDGQSNDGSYCTNVDNHIVDIPRTAYFLAMVARYGRFRVAGVDQLLAPLILDGAAELVDQGVLEAEDLQSLEQRVAYGEGWPFHHHHMHISFHWWFNKAGQRPQPAVGCGWRMPGDAPLVASDPVD